MKMWKAGLLAWVLGVAISLLDEMVFKIVISTLLIMLFWMTPYPKKKREKE